MKKSKFFKSSKDMLSRGFNASKCKTSLRLGSSRLKLLRNKKEVQVKQMKKEIAQLLESGQDRTARIKVEHVTREEKMMAAYDLIEIYCELIVARLAIIESQKICPIDLKEAITSVVFAAPRCGDVPELLEVKKHFTEKYGKDFITAAIELRPQCGVSRMLVEKLSAIAPDGPTKIKILSAIAEEHNVKWDAESFEERESVPSNDLLSGPSTFVKESELHIEPPRYEAPAVQVPKNNNNIQVSPLSFSSVDPRTLNSDQISGVNTPSRHEARPLGDERTQLFHGDGNNISLDRRRWNMEFKDATSAAQAAAESAELASMAARAAAELSTRERITRQCSSESHESGVRILSEQFSSCERTRSRNEQTDEMKTNNVKTDRRFEDDRRGGTKEYNQSSSSKSKASKNDDSLDRGVPLEDEYSRKNSAKEGSTGETSMQGNSFKYKAENAHGWPEISKNVREERIEKQASVKSSNSISSIPDDVNTAGVVFDKSDSDSDDHGFDIGPKYDEHESRFHLPLSGQRSREHLSTNTDSWSPKSSRGKTVESTSSSLFHSIKNSYDSSGNSRSMDGPKSENPMPVTFDEFDGPSSESEEDMRHTRIPRDLHSKDYQSVGSQFKDENSQSAGSPLKKKGSSRSDPRKPSPSSDDDLPSTHFHSIRSQFKDESNQSAGSPLKKKGSSRSDRRKPSLSSDDDLPSTHFHSVRAQFKDESSQSAGSPLKKKGSSRYDRRKPSLSSDDDLPSTHFHSVRAQFKDESSQSAGSPLKKKGFSTSDRRKPSPSSDDDLPSTQFHSVRSQFKDESSQSAGSPLKKKGSSSSDRKQPPLSSDDKPKFEELERRRNRGENQSTNNQPALEYKKTMMELNKINSSSESEEEGLKFENLKGGFRHKGYNHPPYTKNQSDVSSSFSKKSEKATAIITRTSISPAVESPRLSTMSEHKKSSRTKNLPSESDSDSSEEEDYIRKERPDHRQKLNTVRTGKEVNTKPNLASPKNLIFSSDESDSDEDLPKDSRNRINRLPSGISRRTNASPSTSNIAETRKQSDLQKNSSKLDSQKPPTSPKVDSKPAKSNFWGPPEHSNLGKTQESKTTLKSSALEESSTSRIQQKPEKISVSSENLKTAALNKTSSDKDSTPKASHVHPKLPDYDDFIQILRKNRS